MGRTEGCRRQGESVLFASSRCALVLIVSLLWWFTGVPVAALLSILFVVSLRLFILLCFEIGSYVAHTDLQLTG